MSSACDGFSGRGASRGVIAALKPTSSASVSAESAKCPLCGCVLRFTTDVLIGYTLEECTGSIACPNHRPHRPRPDLSGERVGSAGVRKRSGGTALVVVLCLSCFAIGFVVGVVAFLVGLVSWIGAICCGDDE